MATNYTGNSIVDYLKSQGQASDYNTRAGIAAEYGIKDYKGTAEQNTSLLSGLRQNNTPPPATPTGTTANRNTGGSTGSGGRTGGTGTGTTTGSSASSYSSDGIAELIAGYKKQIGDLNTKLTDTSNFYWNQANDLGGALTEAEKKLKKKQGQDQGQGTFNNGP